MDDCIFYALLRLLTALRISGWQQAGYALAQQFVGNVNDLFDRKLFPAFDPLTIHGKSRRMDEGRKQFLFTGAQILKGRSLPPALGNIFFHQVTAQVLIRYGAEDFFHTAALDGQHNGKKQR